MTEFFVVEPSSGIYFRCRWELRPTKAGEYGEIYRCGKCFRGLVYDGKRRRRRCRVCHTPVRVIKMML